MSDPVVEERIVRLVRGAETIFEWRCTPADLEAMVAGRLFAEGFHPDQVSEFDELADPIILSLKSEMVPAPASGARARVPLPDAETFARLYRALFAGVDERHEHGGMHAAALARNDAIVFQAEDVGRHNAVDKVIGMAVLAGEDLTDLGLLVSSRVSGEIARKAARSGVAWLASRSIPTTLAVSLARRADMPIIGRAASKNAFVY